MKSESFSFVTEFTFFLVSSDREFSNLLLKSEALKFFQTSVEVD